MGDQSRENIILCVLTGLKPRNYKGQMYKAPKGSGLPDVPGFQTNEAPLYYLLLEAQKAGKPVDKIIYLASDECHEKIVDGDGNVLSFTSSKEGRICPNFTGDGSITTVDYITKRLEDFVSAHKDLKMPDLKGISYDIAHPEDALRALNSLVTSEEGRVSVEFTGGPRDAVALLTMAMQVIMQRYPKLETGPIVYANLESGTIEHRNTSIGFTELISAAKAFTEYGKADQFCSYFESCKAKGAKPPVEETTQLLNSMETFSNSLSFCVVMNLPEQARVVQENLERTEKRLGELDAKWEYADEALRLLNKGVAGAGHCDSTASKRSLNELLAELDINPMMLQKNELRRTLEKKKAEYSIGQEQTMLLALIPSIKRGFIQTRVNESDKLSKAELILECISWCANHHLVLQALQIFREHATSCLIETGFIVKTSDEKPSKPLDFILFNAFPFAKDPKSLHLKRCKQIKVNGKKQLKCEEDYGNYYAINEVSRKALYHIFDLGNKLRGTRNWISHNEEQRDTKNRYRTTKDTRDALIEVVSCISEQRPKSVCITRSESTGVEPEPKAAPRTLATPEDVYQVVLECMRSIGKEDAGCIAFNDLKMYCDRNFIVLNRATITQDKNTSIAKYLVKDRPDLFPSWSNEVLGYKLPESSE